MDPFLGEIRLLSFSFAPRGWALCNGQLLSINQNQALFSLLGTTYGGDGRTNFALPDLRARTPLHVDGLHPLGTAAGAIQQTLTQAEMPAHTHLASARAAAGDNPSPAGRAWGTQTTALSYGPPTPLIPLALNAVSPTGGAQPHENMQPFLVLTFAIALVGIFPSRN